MFNPSIGWSPFHMTTEFVPHRRQHPLSKVGLAARVEAFIVRDAEDRSGHGFVDGSGYRPSPFA
jgi:hypothetical protein